MAQAFLMDIVCSHETFVWILASKHVQTCGIYLECCALVCMSSVMIWSVESVLLGLWALVLSSYSTPLHIFVARCHLLVSAFTMVLHLYVRARDLIIASEVSQSFVCFVSALFLGYLSVIFADGSQSNPLFFKLPSVGLLSLDACVGLAWFAVVLINGVGMAFSSISKNESSEKDGHKTSLMFHSHGFHLVLVFPCLVMAYTSGFSRPAELGIYSGNPFLKFDHRPIDAWYIVVCIVAWILFLWCMWKLIFQKQMLMNSEGNRNGTTFSLIQRDYSSSFNTRNYYAMLFFTGAFPVAVSAVLLFASLSMQQRILTACLLGVSAWNSLPDLMLKITIPGFGPILPEIPSVDYFFSRNRAEELASNVPSGRIQPTVELAPSQAVQPTAAQRSEGAQSNFSTYSLFSQQRLPPFHISAAEATADPAAVSLNRRYFSAAYCETLRDKVV